MLSNKSPLEKALEEVSGASLTFVLPESDNDPKSRDFQLPASPLKRIAGFELEIEIGRGGMGVVYSAMELTLQRRVALKLLLHSAQIDHTYVWRFHNEALATARLHHPNIVPVYNVGEEQGIHYIAMQFIDGSNLQQVLKRIRSEVEESRPNSGSTRPREHDPTKPIEPVKAAAPTKVVAPVESHPESGMDWSAREFSMTRSGDQIKVGRRAAFAIARFGADIAEALQHAHDMGIIHRDIKPSNLLLDRSGRIWITDFGLAHIAASPGITRTGALLGTLRYMSPEQAAGNHKFLDHRSDVYSLGVTLFEMLALRPAIDATGTDQILRAVMYSPIPSLSKLCRDIPRDLTVILETAMAKNPADRYSTAAEMAADLRRFLQGQPIKASPLPAWKRLQYWIFRHQKIAAAVAAGTICALLTSSAAAYLLLGSLNRETKLLTVTQRALQESEALRSLANAGLQLEKSPGLSLALALSSDGAPLLEQRLAVQQAWERTHESAIHEFPGSYASTVDFNSDGTRAVACSLTGSSSAKSGSCTVLSGADGSVTSALVSTDPISSAVFSPRNRYVLTGSEPSRVEGKLRSEQLAISPCLYDANSGKLVTRFDSLKLRQASSDCFSPDESRLVLCRGTDAVIVDLVSNQQVFLRGAEGEVIQATFSSNGERILTLTDTGTVRVRDASTMLDVRPAISLLGNSWRARVEFADSSGKLLIRDGRNLRMLNVEVADPAEETTYPVREDIDFCQCPKSGLICLFGEGGKNVTVVSSLDFQPVTEIEVPEPLTAVAIREQMGLVVVSAGRFLYLFDLETGLSQGILKGHTGTVLDFSVHDSSGTIVSSANDGTLRFWNVLSGGQRQSYPRNSDEAEGLLITSTPACSQDGKALALASQKSVVTRFLRADGTWLADELPGTLIDQNFRPEAALLTTPYTFRVQNVETARVLYERRVANMTDPDSCLVNGGTHVLQRTFDRDACLARLETRSGRKLRMDGEEIRHFAASHDEKFVVIGTAQGNCRLVDVTTGVTVWTQQLTSPILQVAISQDNSRIAAIDRTAVLTVWDRTEQTVQRFAEISGTKILFLADTSSLLAWDPATDGIVQCLDSKTGDIQAELPAGKLAEVRSHHSRPLAVVSTTTGCALWEPLSGKNSELSKLRVRSPRFLSDRLAGLQRDPVTEKWTMTIWSLEQPAVLSQVDIAGIPQRLEVSATEDLFGVSIGSYHGVVVDTESGRTIYRSPGHDVALTLAGFDVTGKTLISVSPDGIIGFAQDTGERQILPLAADAANVIATQSPDKTLVACGDGAGRVSLISVREKRIVEEFKDQTAAIQQIVFDKSGRFLLTVDNSGTVCFRDLQNRDLKTFARKAVLQVDISPDGQQLLVVNDTATESGSLVQITINSADERSLFEGAASIKWAKYSPDGKAIASIDEQGQLKVRLPDGTVLLHIHDDADRVLHAAFHPDGQNLVTSHPERLSCWSLVTGAEVMRFEQQGFKTPRVPLHPNWNPFRPDQMSLLQFEDTVRSVSLEPDRTVRKLFSRQLTQQEQKLYRLDLVSDLKNE